MLGGCSKWEQEKTDDARTRLADTSVLDLGEQNTLCVEVGCLYMQEIMIKLSVQSEEYSVLHFYSILGYRYKMSNYA